MVAGLTNVLTGAQAKAVSATEPYLVEVLGELGLGNDPAGALNALGFVGHASDGRDLSGLLAQPSLAAKAATAKGYSPAQGKALGGRVLDRIVTTQVADAGRVAEAVGIVVRPHVPGYVRMVNLPACSRCVVLAGRYYKYHQGFKRHPQCDCIHIPASEAVGRDLRIDPQGAFAAGQVKGLTVAEKQALDAGSDLYQVVNAQRGMYEGQHIPGERRRRREDGTTLEGTTRRGVYGSTQATRRRAGERYKTATKARLTPERIMQMAGTDRAEMIRLLRQYRYIV